MYNNVSASHSVSKQFITVKCYPQTRIIPMSSIKSLVFDESRKIITISMIDGEKTELSSKNVKSIFYETVKDIRSCDGRLTDYSIDEITDF